GSGPSPASPCPRDPTIGRPIGGGFTKQPEPTPMGPPRDPANFTATQTGPGTVELRWDPVPGVTTYVLNGAGMPEGRKVNTTSTTVTGLSPGVHEWLVTSWYDPDGSRTNANQWPRATIEVKALSGSYRVTITRVKF